MPPAVPSKSGRPRRRRRRWIAHAAVSLLLAAVGWFTIQWREILWAPGSDSGVDWREMGMDSLQRLSYDFPFIVRSALSPPPRATESIVLLYLDEDSARQLDQSTTGQWSRALHAQLLDRLTADGARAVLFDMVFDTEAPADPAFAAALTRNGRTFLGTAFESDLKTDVAADGTASATGLAVEQLMRTDKPLYHAARGAGLLTFRPLESDFGVARLFTGKPRPGFEPRASLTWVVARSLGAVLPPDDASDRFARRWINFYGPARTFESVSYYRPLVADGGVPPGYFKNKIVIVGARSQIGTGLRKLLDEFSTPWSHIGGRGYTPGAEIHATVLLNLLRGEWLERLPFGTECLFVVGFGLLLGALRWLRPWLALGTGVAVALMIVVGGCLIQWRERLWFNWAVPALVQAPLGIVLAVASRYYLEERSKRKLRSAFGFYLSPELADEIAEQEFTLAPGGEKVEATLVFTDLEGFTTLSEKLGDSARLGEVLTAYFTRTTDEILAQKGTVIKFIGDAVFAAWGAPLPQPDHAERAVRAAWRLSQVSEMDVPITHADGSTETVHVRTRVGVHTGEALAGNLGSARRFDYTLIGDAVNFASRLEGANKYTGTGILLSDETARQLGGKFLLRRVGAFRVKGKAKSVVIHELLGENPEPRPEWLDRFDAALEAWTAGRFDAAREGFEAVKAARGGKDGPSQFYLDRLTTAVPWAGWKGEVDLEGK
ncbi:MAG TPA: adenylate/guanylate cyclase domain-containing protein [Candidatus Didemnitutus sp.]|nr:adenylate/guanylate cyclase domain-containing protein [Candidatus Didemnitutus sp.]